MDRVLRIPEVRTAVTLTNSLATTAVINSADWAGFDVFLKASSGITGMTFYAAADLANGVGGTTLPFVPVFDDTVPTPVAQAYTSISVTSAGACIPAPRGPMFAKRFVKIVIAGATSEVVDIVGMG